MPYSIFEKKATRFGSPAVTITPIPTARISLNSVAAKIFHENVVEFVLMLWDPDQCQMALRPITKKDSRAYKVTYGRNNKGCSFAARSFLNHIGWESNEKFTGPAIWNADQNILEVALPKEHLKDEKQGRLLPVEAGRKQVKAG